MTNRADLAERHVAVVGGGPAGLAAAYRLSADPELPVTVLERSPRFGGLAAGMERDGMRLDFGPHRLHPSTDPAVLADLQQFLGADLEVRRRRGLIFLNGRYLPYPPDVRTALGLGPSVLLRAGAGLVAARLGRRWDSSYETAVTTRLGRPLYELIYGAYAQKVWGLPGSEIGVEQARRRVNQRGPLDLLRLLSGTGREGQHFFYPRGGFGRIPEAYLDALRLRPNVRLATQARVDAVQLDDDGVRCIEARIDGLQQQLPVAHLIWSAPVTELARLATPAPVSSAAAASGLRYRALVIAYAELNVPRVGEVDTYYFPEPRFPFNRIAEQKQFSPKTVPADRTVLVMDLACDAGDRRFEASDLEIRGEVMLALRAAGLLRDGQLTNFWTCRFPHAYPIYDLAAAQNLAALHEWADAIRNLWLIGRQGLFLHNNTHHSLLMGYRAAETILSTGDRRRWQEHLEMFAQLSVPD